MSDNVPAASQTRLFATSVAPRVEHGERVGMAASAGTSARTAVSIGAVGERVSSLPVRAERASAAV